ncbi:tetratricopeptide repeat protein [Arenibacter sp. BSSL-BM3]|uniref:histidine kinase n=1 Tax=Arenibacter arenosicollis TaxID=2762274 RepID=A0ABR7QTJ1_9FLAO|nr:tetratricopeptide repeat protein [Arenibacter arenosicollis]MBC8770512.1 tetratricopeptide repeat protein [Arenibacter arenosicollis]
MRHLLMLLMFVNYGLFAQQHKIDSLNALLLTSRDSPKVDIFLQLVEQYNYLNDERAITLAKQANNLAKQLSYKEGEIRSYYELGRLTYNKGERNNAWGHYEKGMGLARVLEDQSLIALGYKLMSGYYEQENNLPKALEYIALSLAIYADLDQKKGMASCFHFFGIFYYRLAEYDKALSYYFKALEIREILHDYRGMSVVYTNIGNIYLLTSKLEKAKDYFLKSLTLSIDIDDKKGVMSSLLRLGVANQKMGKYDKAREYYGEALISAKELNTKLDEAILLGNMGSTLRSQGKFSESLTYLFAALEIKKNIGIKPSMAHTYNDISESYFDMGRPLEAKKYAQEAIATSEGVDINQQWVGYKLLAQSVQSLGDLTKAYDYLEQSYKLKDSIYTIKAKAKIDELEIQYETRKKEEEILLLKEQRQTADFKRKAYLAGGVLTSFILFLMFNQQRLKTGKNRALLIKEQEVDQMKSKFFANISHEFRTPLTLILGPIETMLSETDDLKVKYSLAVMKKNANRLLKLINQLLDLSKLEAGKFKLIMAEEDIIPIVRGVAMAFHSLAELKEIDLQIHTDSGHLKVFVDREKLEIMLVNLLSNAFKFTPQGGTVKVQVHTNVADSRANSFTISVSDTGVGIQEKDIAHIFNRFYQSTKGEENGYTGTGIGLALTKELVDLHKGAIKVVSQVGIGTNITIELPVRKEQFKAVEIMTSAPILNKEHESKINAFTEIDFSDDDKVVNRSKPQLLLVEDNMDVMHYLKDVFLEEYRILQAYDGEQGIEMAQEHIPDLIISDVMMPKKDGYAVCKTLKQDEKTSHIPIILLTAKASLEDKMEGLETRADDYMTKPFVPKELILKVNNLIASRKKLREKYKHEAMLKPSDVAVNSVDEAFLEKTIKAVEENMGDEEFSVEQLAYAIGMSRSQLHRKLKALLDQSPNQLIRTFRLQRAHDLLKQNAATSSEIAYQVGFSSPSYFTKCFHEQYGCTPSEISK